VRGANNEDVSYFIDRVVFVLHPSFDQPERSTACP
jgi:transcription initiation factor IIF auxiliary subunit